MAQLCDAGQAFVDVDAVAQKLLHIVLHDSDGLAGIRGHCVLYLMFTAKVETDRLDRAHLDPGLNAFPAPGHIFDRARHFEVIDINDEEELEFIVPVARTPLFDRRETDLKQVFFAVALPVATRVCVTVQG